MFLSNHTNHTGDSATYVERRRLEGALQAIIRGLYFGASATSPLTETYTTRGTLIEWADKATAALPRPRWQIEVLPIAAESRRFKLSRID